MNLTLADLRALPLAAALVSARGEVVEHTPEWRGDGPGSASYPVRRNRLVVTVEPAAPDCAHLLDRLLGELDAAAAAATPARRLQVRMLAAALRVVAGRAVSQDAPMRVDDVFTLARAGIAARTGLAVDVSDAGGGLEVVGGEAAALVLVQLAVNAERHGHATAVTLSRAPGALLVSWRGGGAPPRVATSRRRQERTRWGLGFARIAADAMGGVVHAPRVRDDGMAVATLEVGVPRLSLPLAAVRDQRVLRATRAWDEELGATPGTAIAASTALLDAAARATAAPGAIVRAGMVSARQAGDVLWLAVPPDDVADRARDVVSGVVHEQALVDGVGEPQRSRISALAQLLGLALGAPLQRVPAGAWARRMHALAAPFGLRMPVPDFEGAGATDPAVTALLAAEAGERFEADGDCLWLVLRTNGAGNPLVAPLVSGRGNRLRLG